MTLKFWRWRAAAREAKAAAEQKRVTDLFVKRYGRQPADGELVMDTGDDVVLWKDL